MPSQLAESSQKGRGGSAARALAAEALVLRPLEVAAESGPTEIQTREGFAHTAQRERNLRTGAGFLFLPGALGKEIENACS